MKIKRSLRPSRMILGPLLRRPTIWAWESPKSPPTRLIARNRRVGKGGGIEIIRNLLDRRKRLAMRKGTSSMSLLRRKILKREFNPKWTMIRHSGRAHFKSTTNSTPVLSTRTPQHLSQPWTESTPLGVWCLWPMLEASSLTVVVKERTMVSPCKRHSCTANRIWSPFRWTRTWQCPKNSSRDSWTTS